MWSCSSPRKKTPRKNRRPAKQKTPRILPIWGRVLGVFFFVIGAFGTNVQLASGGCSTQRVWGYPNKHFAKQNSICIDECPACHLATALKMAQKNRGPYSGTSVSLAFLMPSAVASITTSSFSFIEFRSTSMCFLQELDLAPPSA